MAKPDFDSIKHLNPYNVEYWEARELTAPDPPGGGRGE